MNKDTIFDYILNNLTVAGATIVREIPEEDENENKSFPDFPLIEIVEGDDAEEIIANRQTQHSQECDINLYTLNYTNSQINDIVKTITNFFRNDYKLGGNCILVSDVETLPTISTEGEMQQTQITAIILYRETFNV